MSNDSYCKALALSKYLNVCMKGPGLEKIATQAMPSRTPLPFYDGPPFIEMADEAFGATGLMWSSDFP